MTNASIALAFLLLLYTCAWAHAGPDSTAPGEPLSAPAVIHDFGHIAAAPLRMDRQDVGRALAFSALISGMVLWADEPVNQEYGVEDQTRPLGIPKAINGIGEAYDRIGTNQFGLGLAGGMYVGGAVLRDRKLRTTAGLVLESLAFTKLFTFLSKRMIGRARPFAERGPRDFHPLNLKNKRENRSLPSGHTSSAFAMMSVLAGQYDHWWVDVPAYVLAASAGFQRIASRSHWAADVIAGGVLGQLVGRAVLRRHTARAKTAAGRPMLVPIRDGAGLAFRF